VLRRTARVRDIWLTEHYFAGESVYNDALLFAFSVPWAKRSGPERARGVGQWGTILGIGTDARPPFRGGSWYEHASMPPPFAAVKPIELWAGDLSVTQVALERI
jgi:hypothetical protein